MLIIDTGLIDSVSAEALKSPRLRINFNLHGSDRSSCNRLLNAIEPDSYIRPHRHLDPEKDETMVMLRGSMLVIAFDEQGDVIRKGILSAGGDAVAVNIPHGTFHTVIGLEPGTVFFEAKAGPFMAITEEEKAPWAPTEGSPEAAAYLEALKRLG